MTHAATGAHTPTTENAAFEHYPLYCYHLSPTITQWCPLRACDIHELAQRRGFEGVCVFRLLLPFPFCYPTLLIPPLFYLSLSRGSQSARTEHAH